jgi:hypothetical protein
VLLLGRELAACLDVALADPLPRGEQLSPGAVPEPVGSHRGEQVVGGAQLLPRVDPAVLPAEPLTVEKVRARELGEHSGTAQPVDGLAVEALGGLALAEQRS